MDKDLVQGNPVRSDAWGSGDVRPGHLLLLLMLLITLGLSSMTARGQLANSAWPAYHHDAQRTGRTSVAGPTTNNIRWSFPTGTGISSSPAIAPDGTVYFGAWDRKLYALNKNGFLKWTFTAGSYISSSPALASDGTLYFGSYDYKVYALYPDGTQRWEFPTNDIVTSSPVVATDGTIYIGSWDGNLYALNPNGTQKWTSPFTTGAAVSSSPALSANESVVYVGSWDGKLYAVNTSNGTQKWSFTSGDAISSSPAVGPDGTVYIGSWDGKLYALDPDTGTETWSFLTDGYIRSSPALASDGTVYIAASWVPDPFNPFYFYEELYAVQPPAGGGSTGSSSWAKDIGSSGGSGDGDQIVSLPAVDGAGRIYIGGKNLRVHALDPSDGSNVWTYVTNNWVDASPAIGDDGTVYVGAWDGKLYAFGPDLTECSAKDFDASGRIDVPDLMHLAVRYGSTSADLGWNPRYDLDNSGQIDSGDLTIEATAWSTLCLP